MQVPLRKRNLDAVLTQGLQSCVVYRVHHRQTVCDQPGVEGGQIGCFPRLCLLEHCECRVNRNSKALGRGGGADSAFSVVRSLSMSAGSVSRAAVNPAAMASAEILFWICDSASRNCFSTISRVSSSSPSRVSINEGSIMICRSGDTVRLCERVSIKPDDKNKISWPATIDGL